MNLNRSTTTFISKIIIAATILLICIFTLFKFTDYHKKLNQDGNKTMHYKPQKSLKITSIAFSGSNPSMGPYNTQSTRQLKNVADHQDILNKLLHDTTVNGLVSLNEYLTYRINNNQEKLNDIYSQDTNNTPPNGARIIDLDIGLSGYGTISLHDLRLYRLSGDGYLEFKKLMDAHSTTYSDSPTSQPTPENLARPPVKTKSVDDIKITPISQNPSKLED